MKRLILFSVMLFLLLCACRSTEPAVAETPNPMIVVGFSQVGAESDWRVANSESMKNTFCEENGYELIFSDARQKQENQFEAIRNFIQQEVDYIVLAPVQEDGWQSVLEEARDAGIPVILVDRMVTVEDDSLYTSWIGSDFEKQADAAMKWLEEELRDEQRDADSIKILHLQGTIGSTAQILRTRSLEAAAAEHPNWSIVAQLQGEFTQAKAYEIAGAYLRENQDLNVVYCENDNMAFGVMQALDDVGMTYGAGGDVIIISFDAARTALERCLSGEINLCVECNPLQGPQVEQLIAQLEAGQIPPKASYVPEAMFTPESLTQTILDGRSY